MDPVSRRAAGASARARAAELAAPTLLLRRISLVAAIIGGAIAGLVIQGLPLALIGAATAGGFLASWQHRHGTAATWRKGARGEVKTARILRRLNRRGYLVLHDRALPSGNANLDHLVVGPTGVWVIDTKNWNKNRLIKGQGRRLKVGRVSGRTVTGSAAYERDRVARALTAHLRYPVTVHAVLAIHGSCVTPWRTPRVDGIPLVQARKVPAHIRTSRRADLSPAEIARLSEACRTLFPPYTARSAPVRRAF